MKGCWLLHSTPRQLRGAQCIGVEVQMAFQPMRQTLIQLRFARRGWFSALADVLT
jgi:hypothetical protein